MIIKIYYLRWRELFNMINCQIKRARLGHRNFRFREDFSFFPNKRQGRMHPPDTSNKNCACARTHPCKKEYMRIGLSKATKPTQVRT